MSVACTLAIFLQAVGIFVNVARVVNHPMAHNMMQHRVPLWTRNLSPHNVVNVPWWQNFVAQNEQTMCMRHAAGLPLNTIYVGENLDRFSTMIVMKSKDSVPLQIVVSWWWCQAWLWASCKKPDPQYLGDETNGFHLEAPELFQAISGSQSSW